jgi:hypothetical protein
MAKVSAITPLDMLWPPGATFRQRGPVKCSSVGAKSGCGGGKVSVICAFPPPVGAMDRCGGWGGCKVCVICAFSPPGPQKIVYTSRFVRSLRMKGLIYEVREMDPERFDIDLLKSNPFKTTNATLRLCFSDTLTYQKRSISNSN